MRLTKKKKYLDLIECATGFREKGGSSLQTAGLNS